MLSEKRDIAISLTGGLGNQLFQIAAALYYSEGNGITVLEELGSPRLAANGVPSALQFDFGGQVRLFPARNISPFWIKSAGFVLRRGITSKSYERILGSGLILENILKMLLSIKFKRFVTRAEGVGESTLILKHPSNLLFGYFQSDTWLADEYVYKTLQEIKTPGEKETLDFYAAKAAKEHPLVVHFRIGDYKNEPDIGLLPSDYYHRALVEIAKMEKIEKIWLFSDEPEIAIGKMPEDLKLLTEIISIPENNDALTLQVMRLGKNYVLSNSTFGWWAARLSHSANPTVLVPDKWFKALAEPKGLIPQDWRRIHAWKS